MQSFEPSYPLIAFADGVVTVYPDESHLTVMSRHALKADYPRTLKLVNHQGEVYRISGYDVVSQAFWNRPKTPFGRGFRLSNLRYERVGEMSLAEVKSALLSAIEERRDLWAGQGDVNALLQDVQAASDIRQLAAKLSAVG